MLTQIFIITVYSQKVFFMFVFFYVFTVYCGSLPALLISHCAVQLSAKLSGTNTHTSTYTNKLYLYVSILYTAQTNSGQVRSEPNNWQAKGRAALDRSPAHHRVCEEVQLQSSSAFILTIICTILLLLYTNILDKIK